MPEEIPITTPPAEVSRFDRLSRYVAHLLIVALAALVAVFGGWQRSINVDALIPEAAPAPVLAEAVRPVENEEPFWQSAIETAQLAARQTFRAPTATKRPDLFITDHAFQDPGPGPQIVSAPAEVKAKQRSQIVTHTVAVGETALGIADAYGISLDTLRWTNDLDDPDSLQIGQELTILPVSGVYHTVRPGDTLMDLAAYYQVEAGAVAAYNGLANADHLALDTKLVFPGGRVPDPPRAAALVSARGGTRQVAAASAAPGQAVAPSSRGGEIANSAAKFLGSPYVWGGAGPRGFDCSGFVQYVFRQLGIPMARDVWGQIQYGTRVTRDTLQPGDLVFFENTYTWGLSHVGIYIGGGRFINAQDERVGVTIASMNAPYWAARYYGARRVQ